jgi:hypothetical protein
MRRLKILVAAIIATAALTAIAATTATAALPEFEPGAKGETFTGTSATGTLETSKKGTIECATDKVKGTLLSKTEALITVDFETCKVFGLVGAHSLGDKEGVILVGFKAKLCYINKSTKDVGLLGSILALHLEVPSAAVLLVVLGSVIGLVTPVNTKTKEFEIKYEQKEGTQLIKKCEGGPENLLFTSENEGAFELSGEGTTEKSTFTNAQELLA